VAAPSDRPAWLEAFVQIWQPAIRWHRDAQSTAEIQGTRLEVQREVADTLQAHRTRVAVQRVFAKARAVHEVATGQLFHRSRRRKEVLMADWAVGLHCSLAAHVLVVKVQRHARVARHAVEGVAAEAPPAAAHVAEGAVVDVLACTRGGPGMTRQQSGGHAVPEQVVCLPAHGSAWLPCKASSTQQPSNHASSRAAAPCDAPYDRVVSSNRWHVPPVVPRTCCRFTEGSRAHRSRL
jgi:hypothetical protein